MIRLATGSDGTKYWRPIYIGFIKNNYIRRTLCAFAAPFVFVIAAAANLIALAIYTAKVVVVGVWLFFRLDDKSVFYFEKVFTVCFIS